MLVIGIRRAAGVTDLPIDGVVHIEIATAAHSDFSGAGVVVINNNRRRKQLAIQQEFNTTRRPRRWPVAPPQRQPVPRETTDVVPAAMSIAREFAGLVESAALRDEIFGAVEREYLLACELIPLVTGDAQLAQRFPQFRRRLARRLKTMNEVSRQQVQLLRDWRRSGDQATRDALLLSINCAAAGLGATG